MGSPMKKGRGWSVSHAKEIAEQGNPDPTSMAALKTLLKSK
jgi:hypothetical protein